MVQSILDDARCRVVYKIIVQLSAIGVEILTLDAVR